MVRLKANHFLRETASCAISIPYGAIKRQVGG